MRVFILIALLCNVAFSALYLNGAEYTQIVTINHSQVAETSSDFLFQLKIPRVGNLITAVESADDVAFTNVNDTTRRARWVVYTPDTIFMYSHIAVSSTVDTSYRIQYGKSLNEVNSSAAFTNCGITNYWGLNEISGATTADYAGGNTGTAVGGVTLGVPGIFYNATSNGGTRSSSYILGAYGPTVNKSAVSLSFVADFVDYTSNQMLYAERSSTERAFQINIIQNILYVYVSGVGATLYYGKLDNASSVIPSGEAVLFGVVFDGSGGSNSDRLKLYINGTFVPFTEFSTGGIPATTGTVTSGGLYINGWTNLSHNGVIDEVMVCGAVTSGCFSDRYNMLFTPSTFSTLGTPLAPEFSAEMGIDTLTFTCSAEGAITYQWYLDGAEMVGETDSVLVIYADSTFYSTAHTLYCLVNSSVISDSWVITTEFSAEMGIDTLRLVCSAENALTYQWYDNNVAVTGATDSVYTIYADSAFYSIKHVIYCLVNGTVKSGEWKFQATTSRTSRWDSFLRPLRYAYKRAFK